MSEACQDAHKEPAGKEGEVKSLEAHFQSLGFEGPVNIILMQMQHYLLGFLCDFTMWSQPKLIIFTQKHC